MERSPEREPLMTAYGMMLWDPGHVKSVFLVFGVRVYSLEKKPVTLIMIVTTAHETAIQGFHWR